MTDLEKQQHEQLRDYYEEVLATLNTPGWKYLTEDWQNQRSEYGRIENATTAEQLYFNKGVVNNLDYLLNMKEQFEKGYEQNFGGSTKPQIVE